MAQQANPSPAPTPGEIASITGGAKPFFEIWDEDNVYGVLDVAMDGTVLLFSLQGEPHPCLLYTSPSPRDATLSRMPSSA